MNGTTIKSITAHQVYTNRGNPGVEARVTTENGAIGRAMCTSGVSVGTHEIRFQFDGGTKMSLVSANTAEFEIIKNAEINAEIVRLKNLLFILFF